MQHAWFMITISFMMNLTTFGSSNTALKPNSLLFVRLIIVGALWELDLPLALNTIWMCFANVEKTTFLIISNVFDNILYLFSLRNLYFRDSTVAFLYLHV